MKTKRITKVVLLMLCLVMLVSVFAACDDGNELQQNTTVPQNGGPSGPVASTIPDELDYGGHRAKMLIYSSNIHQLFPEKLPAEATDIRTDIFIRNQQIELDLNVRFDITTKAAHMSSGDDADELYQEALTTKTEYEAICSYSLYPSMMALEGILYDMNALSYPTTEMPWFPSDIQEYAIMDRLFFVANNSSIKNMTSIFVTYANKKMIADKNLEDIENVVLNGQWTLAKMKQYSRNWAVEAEANPGSVYGVFMHGPRNPLAAFYYGYGFTSMRRDANNMPAYAFTSATDRELVDEFVDNMLDLFISPECGYGPYFGGSVEPLKNETAVFYINSLDFYGNLKSKDTYAMIPMPKATETQAQYLSCRTDAFDVWCVPYTATDPEIGGVIIEAISYDDYANIAPKFWENDFIYRYSGSEKGVRIFEMIRNSVKTDFGRLYRGGNAIGSPFSIIGDCFWQDPNLPTGEMTNVWINKLDKKTADFTSKLLALQQKIRDLENTQRGEE